MSGWVDAFTGADGAAPDARWTCAPASGWRLDIRSNKLMSLMPALTSMGWKYSCAYTPVNVSGDFSYEGVVAISIDGANIGAHGELYIKNLDGTKKLWIGLGPDSMGYTRFGSNLYSGGSWSTEARAAGLYVFNGTVKIERSGSLVACSYKYGGGSYTLLQSWTFGSDDVQLGLGHYDREFFSNSSCTFDDVTFTSSAPPAAAHKVQLIIIT
jgi:hypothetical protein